MVQRGQAARLPEIAGQRGGEFRNRRETLRKLVHGFSEEPRRAVRMKAHSHHPGGPGGAQQQRFR